MKINELCDELEERIKGLQNNGKKRIMTIRTPMAIPNWKLLI
jgi:benzoyl-CoA reductase/2-hydroxyglutaryl-CoA dehydratase subunit BcrC/BadD/HgdB